MGLWGLCRGGGLEGWREGGKGGEGRGGTVGFT